VGKQTLLGVVGAIVLGFMAWRADAKDAWIFGVCALALILVIAFLNFRFADAHPAEAMLEGAEMLALQHQVLAAKSIEAPKDSPVIPDPAGKPPDPNPPEAVDQ